MQEVNSSQTKQYLTMLDIAIQLEVSERTIARWIRAGKLRAFRLHNVTRIHREDYENFLKQNTQKKFDEMGGD